MKLILQRHKYSCGATAIAMVTGVPLSTVEQINGIGITRTAKLVRTLHRLGMPCGHRLIRLTSTSPVPAPGDIVRIRWDGKTRGHWAVRASNGYLDSAYGLMTDDDYRRRKGKVTSFLPIGVKFRPWNSNGPVSRLVRRMLDEMDEMDAKTVRV